MKENNKYAWTWNIKEEFLTEYVTMHQNPWLEVLEEHTRAGYYNYSIFQNGSQFFYCYQCDDVKAANEYIAASEICQKWNAITSKMVEGSFDFTKEEPIRFMKQVFYLE